MSTILELTDLSVAVEGRQLLHQLNLTISSGEVHALLGPNGCGKTTLLMTMMGYPQYQVTSGQILFEGIDITGLNITQRARLGLGLAQQRPPTIAGVHLQHLVDYVVQKNWPQPQQIEALLGAFRMQPFLNRDINAALSGGEIKRSELFQLLMTQPKLALLDEPDSGIDLETLPTVGQMVNILLTKNSVCPARRSAALLITHTGHILDYVQADKAHIMLEGRLECAGHPSLMLAEIRRSGYEGCVHCMQQLREVIA
jgi:Fe-S cluster assembly ATP-binding protein